ATMALSQSRRIYRQTLTLISKNLLLYYRKPLTTLIRALIVPIGLTLILCYLKNISAQNENLGPSGFNNSPAPIYGLVQSINAASSHRLVFVTNGINDPR